ALRGLGGWPALGGLTAATLAGVWLGVSPPQGVSDPVAAWLGQAGLAAAEEDWTLDPVSTYAYEVAYGG
ncbi:hypothetical protein E0K89_022405, partial [Aquicoccus sp. SCR17]|nr:hypothetical protein [Carideicomes alvinocaridis]